MRAGDEYGVRIWKVIPLRPAGGHLDIDADGPVVRPQPEHEAEGLVGRPSVRVVEQLVRLGRETLVPQIEGRAATPTLAGHDQVRQGVAYPRVLFARRRCKALHKPVLPVVQGPFHEATITPAIGANGCAARDG
jgi:hypothetical protein